MINQLSQMGYEARIIGAYDSFDSLSAHVAPFEASSAVGSKYFMQMSLSRALTAGEISNIESDFTNAGIGKWTSSYISVDPSDNKVIYIAWEKRDFTTVIYGNTSTLSVMNILLWILIPVLIGVVIWAIIPDSIKNMINMMIMMGVMMAMMKIMGGAMGNDKPKVVKSGKSKTEKALGVAKAVVVPGTKKEKALRIADELIDPESKKAKAIRIAQSTSESGTKREKALRAIDTLAGYEEERRLTKQQVI